MNAVISAIIVNYNAGELLLECIKSLLNCPVKIEIIVVDNASSDGSLDALDDFTEATIIRNHVNIGFSAGCNKGLKLASADYLLFLNPDCSFDSGAVKQMLSCLQAHEQVGMVGGLLVNPDGTEQAGGRRAVPTPWRSFVRAFGLSRLGNRWPRLFFDFYLHKQPLPAQPIEVEAISGACMLVKRAAIDDVGLWDEGYFLHCEDLDWCMRFRQKGWTIMFVPGARIIHALGRCGRNRRIFVEWHKHKGMMRFYRKFFQHRYPGILMVLVALGVWLRFGGVAVYYIARHVLDKLDGNSGQAH
ncbi:MAG: glycosyltransferase family 2 protein [Methylobacter sp.]|nr:MAG: glycosyltransferase family 2 protein [Methylobacter sp.]